ncbi:MAG: HAMP domain-containing histidine kinase [Oscillospiraceae bacterium]|nr:HAMP domain-containing histidine kinase [Oscillospiraceae bacterium]
MVIILITLVAVALGIRHYYYTSVQNVLTSRAEVTYNDFTRLAQDSALDYRAQVRNEVASFEFKDQMEMMVLSDEGLVLYTSSGFAPDNAIMYAFYTAASQSGEGALISQMSGERVMAVTVYLAEPREGISSIRFLATLTQVDRQVTLLITATILLGVLVLALVLFSSSYFINSIVNPVGQLGETARKIAGGDFGARLEKKNNDEIGELCDIINHMAEELGATEMMKNDFISSVSHELRTPLTAIRGWGETILTDQGEDKQTLEKGMKVIISETDRLTHMVEELLDFSRMQSGRLKLVRSRIDPLAELGEAFMMYTDRARREGLALSYDEPEDAAYVWGDKNKLRQVFVNVIDNAVKYSNPGGSVSVNAKIIGEDLVVQVEDTGIGISEEDLPKVKAKFYKADSTRRGSGIGLAVADEIIGRHGGKLDLASVQGKGTIVIITLPLTKRQDETAEIN